MARKTLKQKIYRIQSFIQYWEKKEQEADHLYLLAWDAWQNGAIDRRAFEWQTELQTGNLMQARNIIFGLDWSRKVVSGED